jgi:hypothetical protein
MGRYIKSSTAQQYRDDVVLVEGQNTYTLSTTYSTSDSIVAIGGVVQPLLDSTNTAIYTFGFNSITLSSNVYIDGLPLTVLRAK